MEDETLNTAGTSTADTGADIGSIELFGDEDGDGTTQTDASDTDSTATTAKETGASDADGETGDDDEGEGDSDFESMFADGTEEGEEDAGDGDADGDAGADKDAPVENAQWRKIQAQRKAAQAEATAARERAEALEAELTRIRTEQAAQSLTESRTAHEARTRESLEAALMAERPDLADVDPESFDEILSGRVQRAMSEWDAGETERAAAREKAAKAESLLSREEQLQAARAELWEKEVPAMREKLTAETGGKDFLFSPFSVNEDGSTALDFLGLTEIAADYARMTNQPINLDKLASDMRSSLKQMNKRSYLEGQRSERKRQGAGADSPPPSAGRGRGGQSTRIVDVKDLDDVNLFE